MGEIISYKDLDVWQQRRVLVKSVYELTKNFPKEEQFGLTNQARRAAVSVTSNIAEGCGRNHYKDSTQFFFIARASLYEPETQLIVAGDLEHITGKDAEEIISHITPCKKLLNGFINYFQRQSNNNQPTTINEILEEYGSSSKD